LPSKRLNACAWLEEKLHIKGLATSVWKQQRGCSIYFSAHRVASSFHMGSIRHPKLNSIRRASAMVLPGTNSHPPPQGHQAYNQYTIFVPQSRDFGRSREKVFDKTAQLRSPTLRSTPARIFVA
jgi:hypothetical protein